MEEDAGKSVHDRFPAFSAVDLNRAGVPLVEIVSEPELRSARQAEAYLVALKQILEYAQVSDVNMEEGSLRVDANVSAREHGRIALGTKTEIKNLNSFSGVMRALDVEFARQCAILDAGGTIEQQTMAWDERAGDVRPARSKEGSHDYRYFPEPDLPPLILDQQWIERVGREMPELPDARRERYRASHVGLTDYDIDVLTSSVAVGDYFEQVARQSGDPKTSANWVLGEVLAALKASDQAIDHFTVRPADLAALILLTRDGTISTSAAKHVFAAMVETGDPPARIVDREGLRKVTDDAALTAWIDEVVAEHPDEAKRLFAGEKRLQGVLVGHVMKKSKGSADPKRVNQLLETRVGT
jgi:aspartyl-tRNA(Asn)/glutamyl-tRNA(Gln) amidotransferase subunit B